MLSFLRKIIPHSVIRAYHYALALFAATWYRHPSEKMIVIGITGTSGKSTVVYIISKMLEHAGFRVGAASTILFKIDKKEWLNDKKMTMIGRFALQKLLSDMTAANCQYAVIETTSQGIEQFRHLGINYDVVICTNLYPEHIDAHGGFESYKKAKLKLFQKIKDESIKTIAGAKVKKVSIVNLDDEHVKDFLAPWAEEKYGFTITNASSNDARVIRAEDIAVTARSSIFSINHQPIKTSLLGKHNVNNILAATCVGVSQGLSIGAIASAIETIAGIPGRMEFIDRGQNFYVVVDYAFEPRAVEALYNAIVPLEHKRIIHVLGSTGGGRDMARRPLLGELAGTRADMVVVTNEDPYDDDPMQIINDVAVGAQKAGKVEKENLFKILDRKEAISFAISLAQAGDLVLVTGKGSEQAIAGPKGTLIPWDDRKVVSEELDNKKGI